MKPRFLAASSALLCLCVLLISQESEARRGENNKTCRETLFKMDKNYTVRNGRRLRSRKALDCFGLGSVFANTLDFFLKSSANGTSPWTLKVKFYASSRNQMERVAMSHGKAFGLAGVDFDITRRTVLIVHGFMATGDEEWIADMSKALLKWDDVNIFVVDWSDGSNTWNYYKAAVNTRTVGDQIATFFGQLVDAASFEFQLNEVNPTYGPLHFIGHSLGSHICGYAAKEMKKRNNKWIVQRITGLDPAQPCFTNSDPSLRLDQDDAPFVDIIHTNGRQLTKLGLGLPHPIGHVDFYPNGGKVQPGCGLSSSSVWTYLPLPVQTIAKTICSHGRSYLYFIDSIVSAIRSGCTFWAQEWDLTYEKLETFVEIDCKGKKCIEMGINSENYAFNGTFLTFTGRTQPYCYIDMESKKEVKELIQTTRAKLSCDANVTTKDVGPEDEEILVFYD